jgi:hypothetical protein
LQWATPALASVRLPNVSLDDKTKRTGELRRDVRDRLKAIVEQDKSIWRDSERV